MASKVTGAGDSKSESSNLYHAEECTDSQTVQEGYVHNPEEFIDIHGSHPNKMAHDTNGDDALRNLSIADSSDGQLSNSPSTFCGIQNLKAPVQVSEESEQNVEGIYKPTQSACDSSDEEYQSADDGDGNSEAESDGKMKELDKESEETGDSDDEFIPVGDEDNINDDNGNFSREGDLNVTDNAKDKETEADEEPQIKNDMEIRQKLEETYTEEERQEKKEKSQKLKDDGNKTFHSCEYDEAIKCYSEALDLCPLNFHKERSIMFSNRAACKMKKELNNEAIQDCSSAIDLHPHYVKAILRRAELYEKTEKLDEALKDYQRAVELDSSLHFARAACIKLAEQIKERNEKMKEEMIGKLKDLGNMVLRPFGLSVNNFNLQQDPNTGSYSVQFSQNSPKNES